MKADGLNSVLGTGIAFRGACLAFSKVSLSECPAPLCQLILRPWIEW